MRVYNNMSSAKTIPSILNATTVITAPSGHHIYITALLENNALSAIDGESINNTQAVSLVSPIRCKTFTARKAFHIAYYISI